MSVRVRSAPTSARRPQPKARPRPLLVRPGARFRCAGDGTCCTDIHALGPVTRAEKRALDPIAPDSLVRHPDLQQLVFRTGRDGQCVHRNRRGCALHARHGAAAKPSGCTRFPFGLVATPDGGRVTTEHRCPCRTLGERPPLDAAEAERSLRDSAGRLVVDARAPSRVALSPGKRVLFRSFKPLEAELMGQLTAGGDPLRALGRAPLGRLRGWGWAAVARALEDERDGSAYGEAQRWFARGLDAARGRAPMQSAGRPWARSFDAAEARAAPGSAEEVLADWLCDWLWALTWTYTARSFSQGRRELATLYVVAIQITSALIRSGVRADRAAAEAVMVVELTSLSEIWEDVQKAMAE